MQLQSPVPHITHCNARAFSALSPCTLAAQALISPKSTIRPLPTTCRIALHMVQTKGSAVPQHAFPATPQALLKHIPDTCDFVLIGEASHGTHEFYRKRAELTKLLIEQRHFNAVALEAGAQAGQHLHSACEACGL